MRHETGSVASARITTKRVNENTSGSEGLTDMIVNGTAATGHGPGSDGAGGMTIGSPDVRTVEIDMKTMTKSTSGTGGGGDDRTRASQEKETGGPHSRWRSRVMMYTTVLMTLLCMARRVVQVPHS